MSRRIGVYPGSFDPVHFGHVAFAKRAITVCGLEEVHFFPEERPRGKEGTVTGLDGRAEMLKRATKGDERLRVLQRNLGQFTVAHTLPKLETIFPADELTLLTGSDVALSLPYWEGLGVLAEKGVSFAVGLRSDHTEEQVRDAVCEASKKCGKQIKAAIMEVRAYSDMSSSRVRSGDVRLDELHPNVAQFAIANQLYPNAVFDPLPNV